MYWIAYQRLKSRPGFITPGIIPSTLEGLLSYGLHNILESLRIGDFRFTPRVQIPKDSGKSRLYGNPWDLLVQEVMRMVLEAIYEPIFKDTSHGFRPNKGCHTALKTIYTKFPGCT